MPRGVGGVADGCDPYLSATEGVEGDLHPPGLLASWGLTSTIQGAQNI